jgi:hypothetical protein
MALFLSGRDVHLKFLRHAEQIRLADRQTDKWTERQTEQVKKKIDKQRERHNNFLKSVCEFEENIFFNKNIQGRESSDSKTFNSKHYFTFLLSIFY